MRPVAFSHLRADGASISLSRWEVTAADATLVDPEHVPDWDPEIDLHVVVHLEVDLEAVRSSSGMRDDGSIGALLRWHASGSGLRGASGTFGLRDGHNEVRLDLSGPDLGGILQVDALVMLTVPSSAPGPLTARRIGSLLWEGTREVRLEGSGGRFPTTPLSFEQAGVVKGLKAAWLLHFDSSDLYDSGPGSVRLLLNTDHPRVQKLMETPDSFPVENEVLRLDITRQMLVRALHHEDLDLEDDYPSESLGGLLSGAVRRVFPHNTLAEVRALRANHPGEFEAHVQARGRFLQ